MSAVLRADSLSRRFGGRCVVSEASLTLAPAEWVALSGPSGCGKTSLLQILGLLDRPDEGRLWLGDREVYTLRSGERARLRLQEIGFVFQQHNLIGHLSARENIAVPAWRLSGSRQAAFAAADELLERFGLSSLGDRRAELLSGGEAQRTAVARALVNRPRLVLADEPTGSLDSAAAKEVLAALREVCAAGAALLLVTHDAAVAAQAPRRLSMFDGKLAD